MLERLLGSKGVGQNTKKEAQGLFERQTYRAEKMLAQFFLDIRLDVTLVASSRAG